MDSNLYIGRFAPSPSGPLHLGSLAAALASYFDARAHGGQWLVRMEDLDPPREQPQAAAGILQTIEAYGMEWDGSVLYQGHRYEAYQQTLEMLAERDLVYPCTCSRKKLAGFNGCYPGFCRHKRLPLDGRYSLRLKCADVDIDFHDLVQGEKIANVAKLGDFILRRKDLLYAYQLAVCVDDQFQKVTHVVRGFDLIESVPRQLYLQSVLNYRHPVYAHVPVIVDATSGEKLSKQNKAPALPLDEPRPSLIRAIQSLGLAPDDQLRDASIRNIIQWGVDNWQMSKVPRVSSIGLTFPAD